MVVGATPIGFAISDEGTGIDDDTLRVTVDGTNARSWQATGRSAREPLRPGVGWGMEHRECQNCGIRTKQELVNLTAQAVHWTVFICTECGTMARARRSRPNWATAGWCEQQPQAR